MSMICKYLRVTAEELDSYLKDISLLEEKICSETSSIEDDESYLDTDKAWGGIFYMLTGYGLEELALANPTLSWAVFGDERVDDDQDLGYGPAGFATVLQVKDISNAINAISVSEFRDRYNPEEMTEKSIYPDIWNEGDDALNYIIEYFEALKKFYATAAQNDDAVITYIN